MPKVDRRLDYLNNMAQKYAPQIANLLGLDSRLPTSITVGQLGDGHGAESSYQGGITFDRNFLRTTSKTDLRGALIHELTHVEGGAYGKPNRQEVVADYARYTLNPSDPGWNASPEVLAMAEKRGTMAGTDNNGGRPGRGAHNSSNGAVNVRSKQKLQPYAPPLPPSQSLALNQQAQALQSQYMTALAAIRAQGGAIRGQFKSTLGDIRANRIAGAAETEGAALSRGIVGSSADLGGRAAVVAQAGAQRVDARGARNSALAQLRVAEMQAQTDLQTGAANLAADKAAAQAELANQRFMQDMFDAKQQSYNDAYQAALRKLIASGKNASGISPLAPLQPYGGQYGGKVEPRGLYYAQDPLAPAPAATTYQYGGQR